MIPARNEYEYPNTVAVLSDRRIGASGEVITTAVHIRGKRNQSTKGNNFYNAELWEKA